MIIHAVIDTNVLISALSVNGTYLITGNTKHFPTTPIVVTPAEMLRIIESEQLSEKI